ncbi:MAG: peptide chain release factor N(5)-glutamine methyltransferase [Clostridia bacterium]|nr:peptide chain release factor N(5)-glutamine methyltransferase [Clostridia bacterium]
MVIRDCILKALDILRASGVENPTLDARVLLCHAIGEDNVYLALNPDAEVSKSDEETFFKVVSRRANHEPVAYITGNKEFMSMDFYVDSNVLIPRPDTEHLAELAIELIKKYGFKDIADFCTGSGALAVSIGKFCPDTSVTGYDISIPALDVANKNKDMHSVDNVSFAELDVLNELSHINRKFDMVVSNPPYITGDEMKTLDRTVDEYEPHLALYGGEDGLDFYRVITDNAHFYLKDGGVLAFEVGHKQADDVAELMKEHFTDIKIKTDYAGIKRVVYGKKADS